ncbi:MAG: hypothetical protein R2824_23770, partial [Saprospiraceae bacterium]
MKMPNTLLILVFCCLTQLALAQYDGAKEGFAFRMVAPNHQYLIDNELIQKDFGLGMEFEYLRQISSALNFSVPMRLSQVKQPLNDAGDLSEASKLGLDLLLHLKYCQEPKFIYPHLYAGVGTSLVNLEKFGFEVPVGLGLNFRLGHHIYLSTKAEYRLAFEDLRDHVQVGAGILFIIGPGEPEPPKIIDRDGDGVSDSQDLCPDTPGLPGLNGCPDADGDGVTDGDDDCPMVAGLASLNGCPDADGDGV